MAFIALPRRKSNIYEVGVEDEALRESLNAGKKNFVLKGNRVVPETKNSVPEDEPLPEGFNSDTVSFEAVRDRTVQEWNEQHAADRKTIVERKKQSRRLTARRFFETIVAVGLVIAVGVLVMLLLSPQTDISELARDNSDLKDAINSTKREIVNAEENANGIADMDVIRAQALALGMQDPNQNQVINLPVPNTDSLRTSTNYNTDGISDEAFNDSKDALADYYADHPDK